MHRRIYRYPYELINLMKHKKSDLVRFDCRRVKVVHMLSTASHATDLAMIWVLLLPWDTAMGELSIHESRMRHHFVHEPLVTLYVLMAWHMHKERLRCSLFRVHSIYNVKKYMEKKVSFPLDYLCHGIMGTLQSQCDCPCCEDWPVACHRDTLIHLLSYLRLIGTHLYLHI